MTIPILSATRALAVVVVMLVGCGLNPSQAPASSVDAARAVAIARDFVVGIQPSGYVVLELSNGDPSLLRDRWSVQVDARIRIPQDPPQFASLHYIIEVDAATGAATIVAQG